MPVDTEAAKAEAAKLEKHRERRRAQAAARKERARKAKDEAEAEREGKRRKLAEGEGGSFKGESEHTLRTYDEGFGPSTISVGFSPATFPDHSGLSEKAYSPAPTVASSVDVPAGGFMSRHESEYNTENEDMDMTDGEQRPSTYVKMDDEGEEHLGMSPLPGCHFYRDKEPDKSAF